MLIIDGDILDIQTGIIVQQANAMGVMGAGLARQIRDKYPKNYKEYIKAIQNGADLGDVIYVEINDLLYIANIIGQLEYGRNGRFTSYNSLKLGLYKIDRFADLKNLRVYIPYGIGCGLGGGDWTIVSNFIEEILPDAVLVRKDR